MHKQIRKFMETNGFNVLSRIADKFGIRASKLRVLYIYLSFVTFGIAFAFYFVMAFSLWIKDGVIIRRKSVFDL